MGKRVTGLRYDAAIIGAGADGLAAASTLAASGARVIVLERSDKAGGRCALREFHPGFFASPFCDEIAPVPPDVFRSLDLARRGALFLPPPLVTALWPDRARSVRRTGELPLFIGSAHKTSIALQRAAAEMASPKRVWPLIGRADDPAPWPGDEWAAQPLSGLLAAEMMDADTAALAMARALEGRSAHPDLAGSALHLLAPGGSGQIVGGLHRLADALTAGALDSGAEIACGLEVTDIRRADGRIGGVTLADGTGIEARAVLSTLDLKRTFLSLFSWSDLPGTVSRRIAGFRMAGGTARLLLALESLPERRGFATRDLFQGPIHIAPSTGSFSTAYAAWRSGTVPEHPPITVRFVSVADPRLCTAGGAVATATIGCIPARLFDGGWTHEKRDGFRAAVLAAIEQVLPGFGARVLASELIVPPDIEDVLGATDGDLWGGEIAADQMLAFRPWLDCASPRTPVDGLYLAGPSSAAGPLGTCAAGVIAAGAIAADLKAGRLK